MSLLQAETKECLKVHRLHQQTPDLPEADVDLHRSVDRFAVNLWTLGRSHHPTMHLTSTDSRHEIEIVSQAIRTRMRCARMTVEDPLDGMTKTMEDDPYRHETLSLARTVSIKRNMALAVTLPASIETQYLVHQTKDDEVGILALLVLLEAQTAMAAMRIMPIHTVRLLRTRSARAAQGVRRSARAAQAARYTIAALPAVQGLRS